MSEPTTPVTPGQGAGTPPGNAQIPDQSGTTPAGEGTEVAGQQGANGSFLSRQEAAEMEKRILDQSRSYSDKGRVRVEKAVQDVKASIATMKSLGQPITPEQELTLTDAAIRKAVSEPEPAPEGTQPPQTGHQQQVDPNIVEIMQEKGIELYDGDPEISGIDRNHGLRKFYSSIEAACDAKKTRLASQPTNQQPGDPSTRVPPGGSVSTGVAKNSKEYWGKAFNKKG